MNEQNHLISNEYSIKIVTDLSDFEKLKPRWDNLAEKQGVYMPFLCFDWFKVWLEHFLNGNKLLILLLYKGNEIVTIAPCLIKEGRFKGIGVRKIELLGNVYSPIRYFLCGSLGDEEREEYFYLVFRFLREFSRNWDTFDLTAIPEEGDCFDSVKRAVGKAGLKYLEYFCYGDWYLDGINYSGEEYFKRYFTSKLRHNIRYRERKLEERGKIEFKIIEDEESIDKYMAHYYGVYSKSWQKQEGIGPTFHLDLAKMAAKHGWLRLGFLFLDGVPIAAHFWVTCNAYGFILKSVYDQNYKEYGPGKILTLRMIKHGIDVDRIGGIDYVQGDEPYKEEWTPKRRERKGILIYNNSIRGKALEVLERKILPVVNKNKHLRKFKESISKRL